MQFDPLFQTLAQRHGFRTYLSGLLLPRDRFLRRSRHSSVPSLGYQAQAAEVQRLQFFLSEAAWDAEAVNARRLALLAAEPVTSASAEGVLIIDDTGDRKDGSATDHVARQYLGSVGKIDNGIVAVTTLWADEERYYPLHVAPYTPAVRLPDGKHDAAFHTKPQIALSLIEQAPSRRHCVQRHRSGLLLWRRQGFGKGAARARLAARDKRAEAPLGAAGRQRRRTIRLPMRPRRCRCAPGVK